MPLRAQGPLGHRRGSRDAAVARSRSECLVTVGHRQVLCTATARYYVAVDAAAPYDDLDMADLTPRVFISHADADSDVARRIAHDLEAMDVKVWRDAAITPADRSFTSRLREEIRTSDVLLVLVSRASVESN